MKSKYTGLTCLKSNKNETVTKEFPENVKESKRKWEKHGFKRAVNFITAQWNYG